MATKDDLITQLVEQNGRLVNQMAALVAQNSPLEIIRALNPPSAPSSAPQDPYAAEPTPRVIEDAWADETIPTADLRPEWADYMPDLVANPLKEAALEDEMP